MDTKNLHHSRIISYFLLFPAHHVILSVELLDLSQMLALIFKMGLKCSICKLSTAEFLSAEHQGICCLLCVGVFFSGMHTPAIPVKKPFRFAVAKYFQTPLLHSCEKESANRIDHPSSFFSPSLLSLVVHGAMRKCSLCKGRFSEGTKNIICAFFDFVGREYLDCPATSLRPFSFSLDKSRKGLFERLSPHSFLPCVQRRP